MTKFLIGFLCLFLLGMPPAAFAEDAPMPARKTMALGELKSRLTAEKSEQDALQKKMSTAETDLGEARDSLVKLSAALQNSQKTLADLKARIQKLQAEETALQAKIQSDYGSMGNLILAMQRIRRMPTETLIIRPGAPLETAQSAMLLQSILPGINARTEEMSADLNRLQTIHQSLNNDKAKADQTALKLAGQQKDLQGLLKKREQLYRQTRSAYEVQAEAVARMAAEAQSLEQLVSKLEKSERENALREKEQRRKEEQAARAQGLEKPKRAAAVKMPSLPGGRWAVPVQGRRVSSFGDSDEIGAKSKGIKISAAPNALVTAPAGGVVRFAGAFRNYGNMVIIEHDRGFHSLMSGLNRIDISVGQKISAGEPVGTLTGSGAERLPTLYYELRHNGKSVDPSAKFPDLS